MSKRREEVDMEMVAGRTAIINMAGITTRRSRRFYIATNGCRMHARRAK
jgi:hypothetical protein